MIVADKRIITCAITGSIHVPSMSPYLPVSADEIARDAIAAWEAGAAVIHLHARREDDDDGRRGFPDWRPETYLRFCRRIAEHTDAIVNITTGGSKAFSFEQRLAGPIALSPEITSFNLGTVNFALFPLAERLEGLKEWERAFLRASKDNVSLNTFGMMETIGALGKEHGIRFEFECFDVGHLHALKTIRDLGWLPDGPLFIQCVLGIPGGLGGDVEHLVHMKETADRLFGGDFQMSALGAGRYQMRVAAAALSLGMHTRVGLEDSLGLRRKTLATSNADQVRTVRQIMDALSLEPATPAEARALLQTKGPQRTGFAPSAVGAR